VAERIRSLTFDGDRCLESQNRYNKMSWDYYPGNLPQVDAWKARTDITKCSLGLSPWDPASGRCLESQDRYSPIQILDNVATKKCWK
jgi:hypothetical protein